MKTSSLLLLLVVVAATALSAASAELEVLHQWNFLPYRLPRGFLPGDYVPENNVFTGLEVGWNRVFMAVPRLRPGVPATLVYVPRFPPGHPGSASPELQAYPSWDWHLGAVGAMQPGQANCSGLISVYRVRIDRCDRLWVLDSGLTDSLGSFTRLCPPKLLTFDLRSDLLLRSVTFPQDVLRPSSLLTNLVIDDEGARSCDDVVIYMSDTAAPGLVVYDVARDSAWRAGHSYMWPSPDHSSFQVAGESFTLMDGVVGLALSPPSPSPYPSTRVLYFQPMASNRLFSVPTSALKAGPLPDLEELPVSIVGTKSSQSAVLTSDQRDGSVWLSPVRETAVASWQPSTDTARVVAYSPELIQFSSELIIAPRDNYNIWMLSSRFQKFFRRTYNGHEINLRILRLRTSPGDPFLGVYNNTLLPFHGF